MPHCNHPVFSGKNDAVNFKSLCNLSPKGGSASGGKVAAIEFLVSIMTH